MGGGFAGSVANLIESAPTSARSRREIRAETGTRVDQEIINRTPRKLTSNAAEIRNAFESKSRREKREIEGNIRIGELQKMKIEKKKDFNENQKNSRDEKFSNSKNRKIKIFQAIENRNESMEMKIRENSGKEIDYFINAIKV